MTCVAHPPPEVAAIIAAAPSSKDRPLAFRPSGGSANYIDAAGNMDFSCFHHPIRVRLRLRPSHVYFSRRHALSFAYEAGGEERPVTDGVRQFPGGIHRIDVRTIRFTYRNASDCGDPDGKRRCPKSAYGLYLVDANGHVRHVDPIIQNGGGSRY